ncbi:LuxR family transcriptional regulator [Rhodococcus spelaei]|uniref:LuxR family transcriptional regulator n=1 Tax=Rhodococcus spelaei TaxID=2546320 RepID=A0A541BRK1_9NOCA|nr:LuxR C-terminal-related transcriptional regulator [Rhodococcus spelaei]TQF74918.1 LuxR family transcriptional regulator [Rhodococcus spelaei]
MSVANWDTYRVRAQVPTYAHPVIRRQRLLDELTVAMTTPDATATTVALLCAPVGSGKTMLLADWARSAAAEGPTVAWLTVEEHDNGRIAFRAAARAALENSGNIRVAEALRAVPPIESDQFPAAVAEVLGALSEPIWMVLDDAHLLHDPETLDELGTFLRWAPTTLRTIVAGRYEPPIALHRLRLEGRVRDFSIHELAFTEEESSILFSEHGLALDSEDHTRIHACTQGWAAGLRLAAISLAQHPDPSAMIADFTGDSRMVADYLVNEVLDSLADEQRNFVVETSIPDTFTAELAEQLTGKVNAHRQIEALERASFLIERVPGSAGWYRYHPLLREYLRAEVGRQGRCAVADLELTAAAWFADAHDSVSALEHTLHAGDGPALIALLEQCGLRLVLGGRGDVVIDILDRASPSVRDDASMRLLRAAAELARGNDAAATSSLGVPQRINDDPPLQHAVLEDCLRLQVSIHSGGIENALEVLQADPVGATGNPELDAFALLQEGMAEVYLGRLEPARRHLEDALSTAAAAEVPAVTLQTLAALTAVACYQGRFTDMADLAQRADAYGRDHALTGDVYFSLAQLFAALGHYLRVEPESMALLTSEAVPALLICPDPTIVRAAACFGAVFDFETSGDQHSVASTIRDHAGPEGSRPIPPGATAIVAPSVQRAFLQVGETSWAGRVAAFTAAELGTCGEVVLLDGAMALHNRRADAARRALAPVLSGAVACVADTTRIRAWLMEALIAHGRHESGSARAALAEAMTIAEPQEILRPFHDGGEPLRDLLNHHHGRLGALDDFATRARSVIPHATVATGLLTARELELLLELPSWRTAEQIAADLFVSVNTVKTHLRGIYRKLDVSSRRDAITEARVRGLL